MKNFQVHLASQPIPPPNGNNPSLPGPQEMKGKGQVREGEQNFRGRIDACCL